MRVIDSSHGDRLVEHHSLDFPAERGLAHDWQGYSGSRALRVSVEDLRLAADIGIHAHEVGRAQALIVQVAVEVAPVDDDRLAATFDYNLIVEHATSLARQRIALVETFASRLADLCLAHGQALAVAVIVEKPGALTNGRASARLFRRKAGEGSVVAPAAPSARLASPTELSVPNNRRTTAQS